jgi:hypothetical protein
MKFLLGPNQVIFNFNEVFILNFLKSWPPQNIGFGAAYPGIVTV